MQRSHSRSLFSDDTNVAEGFEARIAQQVAQVERLKAINAAFKKDW